MYSYKKKNKIPKIKAIKTLFGKSKGKTKMNNIIKVENRKPKKFLTIFLSKLNKEISTEINGE